MFLGWSSNVYPLEAADVAKLPDCEGEVPPESDLPADSVVLYIRPDGPDALLRGRELVEEACARQGERAVVPVRVVFKPSVAKWNLAASLVRVLRNFYRFKCTGVYHIAAQAVRDLGVERAIRSLDNVQHRRNKDRAACMRRLYDSLRTQGYNDAKPIVIQVCRTLGRRDSLRQGHHRVSACLACGVERMAVRFSAAGALPRELGGVSR